MLDIDGFRFDKATQITVDAQGQFGDYIRECAQRLGKENFFMPGEITGGNTFASIYLGRGREPEMMAPNATFALAMTNNSDSSYFIRDVGENALDAAAFHYTIYRTLTRFLGMDGNLEAGYDAGGGWVQIWNTMLVTNDLVNANTGVFDPRHMFGVTNQDVFRWPAILNGVERMLLGLFITTIHMPGIPKLVWGEEQAFYVLDSTASNYIYGRGPMSPSLAWQLHGCYALGSTQYYQMPWEAARNGCTDDAVSLDHRDPSHPVRNIIKHMYHLREEYPVLNDGFYLQQLSNQTHEIQYPGSGNTTTETGIWSVVRSEFEGAQNLADSGGKGNQTIWLVYHNDNATTTYTFNCSDNQKALLAAFSNGMTVKNLFYPHDELTLASSNATVGFTGPGDHNGCVSNLTMQAYEFKAYVPIDSFVAPPPMITKFIPGHDARVHSQVPAGQQETVDVEIHFSTEMDCNQVTSIIQFNSTTEDLRIARVRNGTVQCALLVADQPQYVAGLPTAWSWKATLENVSNGVHQIIVNNASTTGGNASTNSVDRFMFRTGQVDNPMIFPATSNYTRALIHKNSSTGGLYISHKAAGADKWRYSLNWGSSWSDWASYHGGNDTLQEQPW
jgi:alpha-1,3-glucan synthase